MKKKPSLYFNKKTGNIIKPTKKQMKYIPKDYKEIQFLKNEEGVDIMRFEFDGAIVDVFESEAKEIVEVENGN